jgi:hypothetical protein
VQEQGHLLPQVNPKYKPQHSPIKRDNTTHHQQGGGGAGAPLSMEAVMDTLHQYMHSNDGRMRELESTVVMLESQGDRQVSIPSE